MDSAEVVPSPTPLPTPVEWVSAVEVRVATTDREISAAGALTAEAYHADRLIDDGDEYLDELRDAGRRSQEATLLTAVVPGSDEDVVVGTLTLAPAGSSYAEIAQPGEIELRMLAVAPEARRRGVAEELIRSTMREALRLGAGAVVLSTLDAMVNAQRLYERLGFERVPERDWHHEGVALRVYTWRVPEAPGVRVEAATWRPVEIREIDGWQVGISGGFTMRANSAIPAHTAGVAPRAAGATLDAVEETYRRAGLPSVVRICRSSGDETLDDELDARGYRIPVHTWVMVRPVGTGEGDVVDPPGVTISAADAPDPEWLDGWLGVKAGAARPTAVAVAIVSGSPASYLTARDESGVVGVLRAATEADWVGLSCLAVVPRARRRGVGRALTYAALRAARENGTGRAFLQVEAENDGARGLYESLGFQPADRYHYRSR